MGRLGRLGGEKFTGMYYVGVYREGLGLGGAAFLIISSAMLRM